MRKIKSVTLLKDLPGVKAGEPGLLSECLGDQVAQFGFKQSGVGITFTKTFLKNNPDWFQVEYEEEERCYLEISIANHSAGFSRRFLCDHLFNKKERAEECGNFLESQLDEWLKNRCQKCGGILSKTLITSWTVSPDSYGIYGTTRSKEIPKCQSCGEVVA